VKAVMNLGIQQSQVDTSQAFVQGYKWCSWLVFPACTWKEQPVPAGRWGKTNAQTWRTNQLIAECSKGKVVPVLN